MEIADFGTRLRQARISAGLSQTELAQGIMSASHISLIESGKRSPSPDLLEQLAERLGTSPDYLLSGANVKELESRRKDLLFAEIALRNGDLEFAEKALKTLLAELNAGGSHEFAARTRYMHARVLEGLGRLEEAAVELRKGISLAKASGLPLEAVEMTIALSNCAKESGDFLQALELVSGALDEFPRELRNSATYAQLLSSAIGIHYVRGDYIRAQELSDQALSIFDDRTDPAAQAAVLWNASLTADANQDVTKALMLAQRAAGLYSRADDERSEGVLRIAISWLFTRQTPPDAKAAKQQLLLAENLLKNYGTTLDRAALETEFSRVEWLNGNFEEALNRANLALSKLSTSNDRLQSAEAHLLVARAQISLGNEVESAMNLVAARNILAEMEPSRVNAFAWREMGDIYAIQGFTSEALTAYREALHDAGVPASPLAFSESSAAEANLRRFR